MEGYGERLCLPRRNASSNRTQGWRGSVNSRHFVMSLRDYYIEKSVGESGTLRGPDSWAIDYINIGRARSILEAFDDDANGFVTVNEVNSLTRLRPRAGGTLFLAKRIGHPFTCIIAFPTG